ncbi:polysaccharide degrading enzyme [Yokenella regensburgei]|nr:polysaccharide degrading enzyme [Yokenella regensburgei]
MKMTLNKLTKAMLFSGLILPFAASAASLTMNDDTNTISGLTTSEMLSKDNGESWVAYTSATQNSFPGTVTVTVATKDDNAIKAVAYDPDSSYAGGAVVSYNGHYWSAQWWAEAGQTPGSSSGNMWTDLGVISINTLATFKFTPYTGQQAADIQSNGKATVAAQRKIIGYFPEWGVYDAHDNFTPDKIDFTGLTHLNYGFGIVEDGEVIVHDTDKGPGLLKQLDELTEENSVSYMISVGGWDNSQEGVFETATKTQDGTDKLADSMIAFMQKYGFDGIDVDWEYPDTDAEKAQFTSLIQTLRSKLDTAGLASDKYYQLSAAVTTNHNNIQYINPKVTAPLLDSVNVMAYDIHGAFDAITGHNAPLFANSMDSDPLLNVASTMKEYNETWAVPKQKLMMGLPYYGRGWGSVASTELEAGLPGLFAAGSATVHGQWDDEGQYTGTNPYATLKTMLASGKYTRYWDDQAKVPYLYSNSTQEFFTYDDPESIQGKVDYINAQGFGGAIIWDLSGDTTDHELGDIVKPLKDTQLTGYLGYTTNTIANSTTNNVKTTFMILNLDKSFQEGSYEYKLTLNGNVVCSSNNGKVTGGTKSVNGSTVSLSCNLKTPVAGDVLTFTVGGTTIFEKTLTDDIRFETDNNIKALNLNGTSFTFDFTPSGSEQYVIYLNNKYSGDFRTNPNNKNGMGTASYLSYVTMANGELNIRARSWGNIKSGDKIEIIRNGNTLVGTLIAP